MYGDNDSLVHRLVELRSGLHVDDVAQSLVNAPVVVPDQAGHPVDSGHVLLLS